MAFNNRNLSVLCYANGFTIWHYSAQNNESIVDIRNDPKYFAPIYAIPQPGDIMYITCCGRTEMLQIVKTDKDYVELGK